MSLLESREYRCIKAINNNNNNNNNNNENKTIVPWGPCAADMRLKSNYQLTNLASNLHLQVTKEEGEITEHERSKSMNKTKTKSNESISVKINTNHKRKRRKKTQ